MATKLEELVAKHGRKCEYPMHFCDGRVRGGGSCDACLDNDVLRAFGRELLEEVAKECDAMAVRKQKSAGLAEAAGRATVSQCRTSDGETALDLAAAIRRLAGD